RAKSTPTARSPSYRCDGRLIPPVAIHYIFQRAAGLETRDLLRDIFRYLVGIGVGGVVRGQHHFWVGPERAVHRQRLGGVDVERGGTERAVVEAPPDVGFVLQAAAAGIDHDRRAERTVAIEFFKQRAVENVPCLRRQRQQADQDV